MQQHQMHRLFFKKKQKKIHSGRTEELGGAAPAAKVAHVDGKISVDT